MSIGSRGALKWLEEVQVSTSPSMQQTNVASEKPEFGFQCLRSPGVKFVGRTLWSLWDLSVYFKHIIVGQCALPEPRP